jgi:hypothetical protein
LASRSSLGVSGPRGVEPDHQVGQRDRLRSQLIVQPGQLGAVGDAEVVGKCIADLAGQVADRPTALLVLHRRERGLDHLSRRPWLDLRRRLRDVEHLVSDRGETAVEHRPHLAVHPLDAFDVGLAVVRLRLPRSERRRALQAVQLEPVWRPAVLGLEHRHQPRGLGSDGVPA